MSVRLLRSHTLLGGGRIEQCVEEQLVGHFSLRPVLRPETEQDDATLADRLFGYRRFAAEEFSTENPTAQQRIVIAIGRNGFRVPAHLEGRPLLEEDGNRGSG